MATAIPDPYAISLITVLIGGGLVAVAMGSERGVMICYGLLLAFIALRHALRNGDPALAVLTTALIGLLGLLVVVPLAYLAAYLGSHRDPSPQNRME